MCEMHFPARELLWGWEPLALRCRGSVGLPLILSECLHTQLLAKRPPSAVILSCVFTRSGRTRDDLFY